MTGLADVDGFKLFIQVCVWLGFPLLKLNWIELNWTSRNFLIDVHYKTICGSVRSECSSRRMSCRALAIYSIKWIEYLFLVMTAKASDVVKSSVWMDSITNPICLKKSLHSCLYSRHICNSSFQDLGCISKLLIQKGCNIKVIELNKSHIIVIFLFSSSRWDIM